VADHQGQLVEQVALDQRPHQGGAALHADVLPRLLLQPTDLRREVASVDRRGGS
jgi:hypothetical protein